MKTGPGRMWLAGGLVVGLAFAAGLVCLGATALARGPAAPKIDQLRAVIRLPSSGAQIGVGDSRIALVEAVGQGPVTRYELWIDGARDQVLIDEDGEGLPSPVQIAWRATEPGPHTLMAYVFNAQGASGRSRPVVIEALADARREWVGLDLALQPGDTLESIAGAHGTTPSDLLAANPGWSGEVVEGREIRVPVPADQIPEGYIGDDAAGQREPPPPAEPPPPPLPEGVSDRPGAPSVSAQAGCVVALEWAPVAGADGYRVFTQGPSDLDFYATANLPASSTAWGHVVVQPGVHRYLVSAVFSRSEVEGDPASIDVAADLCPEPAIPEAGNAWLDLELLSFTTRTGVDRAYCYVAPLPGAAFLRIPSGDDDFLTPIGDRWNIDLFAAGIGRLGFLQPAGEAVRLQLECWGWQGGDLSRLGSLEVEHPRPEWDGRDRIGVGDQFGAVYRLASHSARLPQLEPVILEFGPPPPEFLRRPESQQECLDGHTNLRDLDDAEARGDAWGGVLTCLTLRPEDIAVWEWTERANPRYYWQDLRSFRLYFDTEGRDPQDVPRSEWILYDAVSPTTQVYPLPPSPCEETYSYWVVAAGVPSGGLPAPGAAREGPGFGVPIPGAEQPVPSIVESGPSNVLHAAGRDCPPIREVLIEITLDSLEVGHTWDSCIDIDFECEDVDLETYGEGTFFRIRPDGTTDEAAQVTFWQGDPDCPAMTSCLIVGSVSAHHDIDLADEDLLACDADGCGESGPLHNRVRLWVGDGDDIAFEFALWDHDDDSGNDIWCGTTDDGAGWGGAAKTPPASSIPTTGARSAEAWAQVEGATGRWDNDGLDRQDAECALSFITSAVEVAR